MSGRAVAVLTALVVVLSGAVWWSVQSGDDERGGRSDRLLGGLAPRQVAGLDLEWAGQVTVLDRRGEDGWVVSTGGGAPRPADRLAVDRFLGALVALGSGRLLDGTDPAQTGLDRPRGLVALRGTGGEVLATVEVGAPVPGAGTVVVRVQSPDGPSAQVRAVSGGVFEELARRAAGGADGWRETPPVETLPVTEPSGEPEEPSRSWTERAPSEVDRIVLDSSLLVGDEPLDLIRGPRDWVVVDAPGRSVPFTDVSDLLRAVTTARAEAVETAPEGAADGAPVLYLTLADAPGARRETLTLFAERENGARVVPAASTARPGVVLLLPADTARAVERTVRELAAAVSDPGTESPATGRREP